MILSASFGQYRVAVKYDDNWFYSNDFAISYEVSPTTYTITFKSNGGSGTMADVPVSPPVNYVPECKFTPPEGKAFSHWEMTGAEGAKLKVGQEVHIGSSDDGSTTFTAILKDKEQTEKTYTITFNPNGSTVSPTTATTGADGRLAFFPTPTREGYTFTGWYAWPKGNTEVPKDTVFTEDTTIYAHWKEGAGPLPSSAPTPTPTPTAASRTCPTGPTSLRPWPGPWRRT